MGSYFNSKVIRTPPSSDMATALEQTVLCLQSLRAYLESLGQLQSHGDVLEELVVEGVGAVELEDHVPGVDVLDALYHVLGLGFCGGEEEPKIGTCSF